MPKLWALAQKDFIFFDFDLRNGPRVVFQIDCDPLPGPLATAAMRAFAAKGLNLTVDGFGLMQSSLQLLQDFPIHKIKLYGKLIKNLLNDTHVSLLIQDTVSYALARDVQVTTEGIESSQQCTEVEKMGCLLGQGAYLSQPLAVNDFEILLSGQAHNRVQLRHSQENSETLKGFSSI